MAKDPAFLFYPNDWLGGTMALTRSEKGAYMDLLMCQFNNGHLSLEEVQTVLGSDYTSMWTKLSKKFLVDENGLIYNKKLQEEVDKRKNFTASRRKNRIGADKTSDMKNDMTNDIKSDMTYKLNNDMKTHMINDMTTHTSERMENENEDENLNLNAQGGAGGKKAEQKKDFIDDLLQIFCEEYELNRGERFEILNPGKERQAIGTILKNYRLRNKDSPKTEEETKTDFRNYFKACIKISDTWLRENMSPSLIVSKYNEIRTKLKSSKNGKGKQQTSDDELRRILSKHYGTSG